MVRPLRIEYPNAWYHITGRGVERSNIFRDDKDRLRFLKTLRESVEAFNVEIHCYVLMSNHFHFLLKTPDANLSRFMQRFNTAYSTYFNLRHHRVGHLYQGRFKGLLVEADEYLQELSRYIHLNPVRLKKYRELPLGEKSKLLKDYHWSSLPGYTRIKVRADFLHYNMVLGYTGGDNKDGRRRYQEFVLRGLRYKIENPQEAAKASTILGSDSFVVWVKENFLNKDDFSTKAYSHLKAIRNPVSIGEIANVVAKEYGIEEEEIIKRHSRYREARQVLLEISHRLNLRKMSMKEMGDELGGISGERVSQVHKVIQERIHRDKKLARRVKKIIARL
jgi:REP element-mobilizing transposase RayT